MIKNKQATDYISTLIYITPHSSNTHHTTNLHTYAVHSVYIHTSSLCLNTSNYLTQISMQLHS